MSIFATGLGTMTPAPPDVRLVGLRLPTQSLQVQASNPVLEMFLNTIVFDPLPTYYAGSAPMLCRREFGHFHCPDSQLPARLDHRRAVMAQG